MTKSRSKKEKGREGPPLPTISLDYGPLHRLALAELEHNTTNRTLPSNHGRTYDQLATLYGTTRKQVTRWNTSGTIRLDVADVAATSAGFHPSLVWGEDFYQKLTPDPDNESDNRT